MKQMILVIAAVFFLISGKSFAGEFALGELSCAASNGVILQTVAREKNALMIQSQWAGFTKNFKAQLDSLGFDVNSVIQLLDESGKTQYTIQVAMDPENRGVQTVKGDLLVGAPGIYSYKIASIHCRVLLITTEW
jgi:hypothetical protein